MFLALIGGDVFAQSSSSLKEISIIEYRDLIHHPQLYDGKMIRVRGIYARILKSSIFYDFEYDYYGSTWVEFDPAYQSCTKADRIKSLSRLYRESRPYPSRHNAGVVIVSSGRAEVVFTGEFKAIFPNVAKADPESKLAKDDMNPVPISGKVDYSELSDYKFTFVVKCVEKIKTISPKAPW